MLSHISDSTNIWNANRVAKELSPIWYYFWPASIKEGRKLKAGVRQHLEKLKVDDKMVKQIIGDGPMPTAK
uniref:Uncharacterized protein n=1 Tax=Romanomermis culicivorax TaxID=13658 RepID=A0A915II98_ROMCU